MRHRLSLSLGLSVYKVSCILIDLTRRARDLGTVLAGEERVAGSILGGAVIACVIFSCRVIHCWVPVDHTGRAQSQPLIVLNQ